MSRNISNEEQLNGALLRIEQLEGDCTDLASRLSEEEAKLEAAEERNLQSIQFIRSLEDKIPEASYELIETEAKQLLENLEGKTNAE